VVAGAIADPRSVLSPRAMRVALVAPFGLRPKGTTSARVVPIARVLAARGAAVRVVVPPWDDPERSGLRWLDDGVEIVHAPVGRHPLGAPAVLWQMLREVRRFAPDVVHCFKPIGYSGALAYILTASAGRHGTPLVVVDADDLEGPTGWSGRRRLGIAGAVRGAQEAGTLRRAPLVTVASAWLRDYAESLGRSADTVLYLPNGHDVSIPPPQGRNGLHATGQRGEGLVRPNASRALWYTRFTEAAPQRVADLAARILTAIPAARLVVVGEEISQGDRAAVAAAIAGAGIEDRVDWRGYDAGATEDWLRQTQSAAVAIYPMDDDATNRARCPSKVPQLMALGIPVVAESVGEVTSFLAGFEETCLVAPGDSLGFAARTIELLTNGRRRTAVGRQLKKAAEAWRWNRVAGGLHDWYAQHLTPLAQGSIATAR
jgi:glycosyltransferase involved in cell wall biosynthesis